MELPIDWRQDYLLYGGMPELVGLKDYDAKKSYLDGLFATIYFRDIVERNSLEIDFIVNNGRKRLYIQSAYRLSDAAKREQEIRGLRRIPDSFGKLVIVDGVQPLYTDEHGISYMSLMDFMLKPELMA